MRYELVVVGTDPAGLIAAKAAAMRNLRAALVLPQLSFENLEELSVAIRALIPLLTQRRTPGTAEAGGPFDLHSLRAEIRSAMQDRRARIASEVNALGIDLIPGDAQFHADNSLQVACSGRSTKLTADRIVVASGTRFRQPEFVDFANPHVVHIAELLTRRHVPTSLTIVGGHRIALEIGILFAAIGTHVTIVPGDNGQLNDESALDQLFDLAMDLGVKFLSQSRAIGVDAVDELQTLTRVYLDNGLQICSDVTLWCDQRVGDTTGLNLQAVGVCPDESEKLWCDASMKTWNPTVAAVGSVVGFTQTSQSLVDAAETIVTELLSHSAVPEPKILQRKSSSRMNASRG